MPRLFTSDCEARSSPFVRSRQQRDQFLNRDNTGAVIKRALLPQIYTTSRARKSHFLKGRPDKGFSWRLVANRPFPLVRASGGLSGETDKSWVLGKPPISSRLKAIMDS